MTISRPKYVGILVIAITTLVLLSGFLIHKIAKHRAYSLLENAVAIQPFSDSLGNSRHTSRECYSSQGQDYCPALTYVLTEESCRQINATLKKAGCDDEYAQEVMMYKDRPITYKVAEFKHNKVLEVYVNEVNKLY